VGVALINFEGLGKCRGFGPYAEDIEAIDTHEAGMGNACYVAWEFDHHIGKS